MPVKAKHRELYEYSKELDERRDELMGLPYSSAFQFMAGVGPDPDDRGDKELALWQKLESDDEVSERQINWAERIVEDNPLDTIDELKEKRQWQQTLATLFQTDVNFDKFDYRFANDLIDRAWEGETLSISQQQYLEMFAYRYREQLRENIIYADDVPEEVREVVGDDPRQSLPEIFEKCKESYDIIKGDDGN